MTQCPECESMVTLSKSVKLGQFVECPECGMALEVISIKPLELDYAFEEEDWDDWDEEEEED